MTELIEKWTAALRSGNYPQTKHVLRNTQGFCCLGVLADLIDPDAWYPDNDQRQPWAGVSPEGLKLTVGAALPRWVLDQVGLTTTQQERLTRLNDGGASFATIANEIEEMTS